MSVDTVIAALSKVTYYFDRNSHMFTDGEMISTIARNMRGPLMRENIAEFDEYVDYALARYPDATDLLLEEVFSVLNIKLRDELSQILVSD